MSDARWQRNGNWFGSDVEDSHVMVDIESGRYVALNVTAAAAWDALATPCSQAELEQVLRMRFDVPANVCAVSTRALLNKMQDLGLIAPV